MWWDLEWIDERGLDFLDSRPGQKFDVPQHIVNVVRQAE